MFTQKKGNKESNEVLIRCYLDFDGTLSGIVGSDTVNSELYESLQIKNKPTDDYADASFIDKKEMLARMEAGFKKEENKGMMMSQEAADFVSKMIQKNADIIIISKNRKDYINAVLELAGLGDIANKISIKDIRDIEEHDEGDKRNMVLNHEKSVKQKATIVVIGDDNPDDFDDMYRALQESGYSKDDVLAYTADAGQFKWADNTKEVLVKAALKTPDLSRSSSTSSSSAAAIQSKLGDAADSPTGAVQATSPAASAVSQESSKRKYAEGEQSDNAEEKSMYKASSSDFHKRAAVDKDQAEPDKNKGLDDSGRKPLSPK